MATTVCQPEMAQVAHEDMASSSPAIIRQMNAVYDWTGPDDPDNPRNFSLALRVFSITANTALAFVATFAGAIYAPAQDQVQREMQCPAEVAMLPLALYNLGLAFGPLVGAPLSETYGRKMVYVVTTPVFVAFMLGGAFARNMNSLIVCRFFAGMFASPNINNTSATILDYTPAQQRGVSLGIYYSLPSLGATVAPLIGGFILQVRDWRWTQWVAIMVTVVLYLPVLFTKETYKKAILRKRAIRMGMADSMSQQTSASKTLRYFFHTLILRPLDMLFTEPIVTLVSLYNGLIFGLLYAFVTTIPWIFTHYYGFSNTGQSLSYLGVTLGTLIACVPFILIDTRFYQKRLCRWEATPSLSSHHHHHHHHHNSQQLPPETRLVPAMIGSFPLPASLLIAGWTAQYQVHWITPILFQGAAMLSSLLIYASANLFMLDTYGPLYGASASGAMMLTRYSLSFAFPMFTVQMFTALGVGWAMTVLALLSLLMAPIPWCFWVFGERLRRRSKYEMSL